MQTWIKFSHLLPAVHCQAGTGNSKLEQENDKKNDHVLGARGQRNNIAKTQQMAKLKHTTTRPHFQITLHIIWPDNHLCINANEGKGYKEEHDLVVVYRADESDDSDEQQEDAHRDDPSDDVDARHQAEPLPPCCYSDQQQPN